MTRRDGITREERMALYRCSAETLALLEPAVEQSPPFTRAQLNRITAITGLVPVEPAEDDGTSGTTGSAEA